MSFDFLSRTELLLSEEHLEKLANSSIAVFGLGGVGSCTAEMLCRAGIGTLCLIDGDRVVLSNLNRQMAYSRNEIGKDKTKAMEDRLVSINPDLKIKVYNEFISERSRFLEILKENQFDFVIDAIDTLSSKCSLILSAIQTSTPIVSSFGAGGRLNPEDIRVDDISKTKNCRLAYYARRILRRNGVRKGVRAVYSLEIPSKDSVTLEESVRGKKSTIGTISYLPNLFGIYCAAEVIRSRLKEDHSSGRTL
ncbi:MAG: tRNA threonylcarbamoyladenosine dehydratase [Leptospiraceae bacterium]|nr:tRNA threonylcarbamoyladenosine dehydratase [Leptospiraceae bacterium]